MLLVAAVIIVVQMSRKQDAEEREIDFEEIPEDDDLFAEDDDDFLDQDRFDTAYTQEDNELRPFDFSFEDAFPEERFIHYADIHSHNSMAAKFSFVDDADEKATRLYLVVGNLDRFYPDITARVSCGGTFLEINPQAVIEGIGDEFPVEWLDQVKRDVPCSDRRKGSKDNPLVSKCLKVVFG